METNIHFRPKIAIKSIIKEATLPLQIRIMVELAMVQDMLYQVLIQLFH
jgi:hypothetical protein